MEKDHRRSPLLIGKIWILNENDDDDADDDDDELLSARTHFVWHYGSFYCMAAFSFESRKRLVSK